MTSRPLRQQPSKQGQKPSRVSPARSAAFTILRRVEEEGAFASVLLAADAEEMRSEDRALCYELVMGCLRRQLWLDALIEHYSGRSVESLDAPVRRALRLGLYQLRLLTRIPPSAVVNESVNLAYAARVRSAASFINAVLRRATREPDYDPAAAIADPLSRLSVESSHPIWLLERWANAFGFEWAQAFALANNEAPPVAFRLTRTDVSEADVLAKVKGAGAIVKPSRIAHGSWRIEGAGRELRELARRGLIYLQDEASQLVAHVLGARKGELVLDTCAAPGSKTTQIAGLSPDLKLLVAGDIHAHRLRVVSEACARLALGQVRPALYDAAGRLPFRDGTFDRVLVDAPCTGTGTLRRNPEIRWRISPSDVAGLASQQLRILREAARTTAPGGRLVYSTCSVEPEENEAVVAAFLDEMSDFETRRLELPTSLLNETGTAARTWPQRDGADGFFITAFERHHGRFS